MRRYTITPERWKVPFFTIWSGRVLSLVGSGLAAAAGITAVLALLFLLDLIKL